MVHCRYCGTECYDLRARDGHEALCDLNPANRKPDAPAVAFTVEGNPAGSSGNTPDGAHCNSGSENGQNGHIPKKGHK